MSKVLGINADVCLLKKELYGSGIFVNEKRLERIIEENFPSELEKGKNYPAKISISIEFLGENGLNVATEGYVIEQEAVLEEE